MEDEDEIPVTVLLEFERSKRSITVCFDTIIHDLEEEVKKMEKRAKIVLEVGSYTAVPGETPYLLQRFSSEWREYVDVIDPIEITNGDKLRVVPMPCVKTPAKSSSTVQSLVKILKDPSACEQKALGELFPHSTGKKRALSFDPLEAACSSGQKKKKGGKGRPTNVSVVALKKFSRFVPRGKHRTMLRAENRVKNIALTRSMSPEEVKDAINRGFRHLKVSNEWMFLTGTTNNHLIKAEQDLDGAAMIYRKGSVYIYPKEDKDPSETPSSDDDIELPPVFMGKSRGKGHSVKKVRASLDDGSRAVIVVSSPSPERGVADSISSRGSEQPGTSYGTPTLQETRELKQQQDEEYAATLVADQSTDVIKREKEERAEKVRRIRCSLVKRFKNLPESGVRVSLRIPGEESPRILIFSPQESTKVLYQYVFASYCLDCPFGIFKTVPRQAISTNNHLPLSELDGTTVVVEESDDFADPLDYLSDCEEEESFQDVLKNAEEERVSFMQNICSGHGIRHLIDRDKVFDDTLAMYEKDYNKILGEFPFRIQFKGEKAIDSGGVSRDLFSAFWSAAYEKAFDGNALVTPALHSGIDLASLKVIGTVISHGYLATGILPTRVAFPSLACVLCGPNVSIPGEFMIEAFMNNLSSHERDMLKSSLMSRDGCQAFTSEVQQSLTSVLSRYGSRSLPSPSNLKPTILQAAKYEFIIKPCAALTSMHSGVPSQHLPFWEKLSVWELHSLYASMCISPAKVLALFNDCTVDDPNKERIHQYLSQYVGSMNNDELRSFLRYVTGSSVCLPHPITITFNCLTGIARRPIAHTCACQLELSANYSTYLEFVAELRTYLHSDESWYMDCI